METSHAIFTDSPFTTLQAGEHHPEPETGPLLTSHRQFGLRPPRFRHVTNSGEVSAYLQA